MGKRLVTRPRGHFFWGKETRLSNDCCLRQIIWPRIIESPLKRSCFLLPCISPCLLAASQSREREWLQPSARSHIISSKRTGKSNISHQNRPFIVVTSCLITTTSPRERSGPSPQSQAHHTAHPTSILRRSQTLTVSQRTQKDFCLIRAALLLRKASQKPPMDV